MRVLLAAMLAAASVIAALIFAPAASASAVGCTTFGSTESTAKVVDARDLCFFTTTIRVEVGETVTWTNRDAERHTVIGANQAWGSTNVLEPGSSISRMFTVSGVYPYYCRLHEGMVGSVIVGDGRGAGPAVPGSAPLVREGETQVGPSIDPSAQGKYAFSTAEIVTYGGAFAALAAFIGLSVGLTLGRRPEHGDG